MTLVGTRTHALLIVIVLALAAAAAGLMVLGRMQSSTDSSPGRVTPPKSAPPKSAPPKSAPPKSTPHASRVQRPSATPSKRRAAAGVQASAGDRLPVAIRQALAANHVVVVALYDPKAKIDGTALREALAGAQLAGTTFVAIDVTKDEVDSLTARYGVIQDPAVLVLRPPGDLVVRIDGFADRDTVAQAATNAAS